MLYGLRLRQFFILRFLLLDGFCLSSRAVTPCAMPASWPVSSDNRGGSILGHYCRVGLCVPDLKAARQPPPSHLAQRTTTRVGNSPVCMAMPIATCSAESRF